jgi:CubicO group peptidase (beta-lactamase class C family)
MPSTDRESSIFTAWQNALNQFSSHKNLSGVILTIFKEQFEPIVWSGTTGKLDIDQPYFISELGNLHLLAIIMKLKVRGLLTMDQSITEFLSKKEFSDLVSFRDSDITKEVTISHLLSQVSGIPDFFNFSLDNENTLKTDILSGLDQRWEYNEMLQRAKSLKPKFKPGRSKKAIYSGTNDQLLGKIIERINGKSLEKTLNDFHFNRLSMKQTYVYNDIKDRTPLLFTYKNKKLSLPMAMSSMGAAGGIVSTAGDCMTFLKAFFHGHLFPISELENTMNWIPVSQGLYQGKGILRFQKPGHLLTIKKDPEIIGSSGFTSGSFSFYVRDLQTFITGTTNQADDPLLPYKLAISLIKQL